MSVSQVLLGKKLLGRVWGHCPIVPRPLCLLLVLKLTDISEAVAVTLRVRRALNAVAMVNVLGMLYD